MTSDILSSSYQKLSRGVFLSFFLYVVLKILKLLGRAWARFDEAVCRAQTWLQRVR